MSKTICSFLLALLFLFSTTVLANVSENEFENALYKIGNDKDVVGMAVAVVRKGESPAVYTYGKRDINSSDKITPETVFRIASLSKSFAATLAVQLSEEGKLSLDSPISRYNSDFRLHSPVETGAATLTHVLSHRLSLPPYAYDNLLEADVSPPLILREMQKVRPVCRVGGCYAYQNVGYDMIASAIEAAEQGSFTNAVANRLFKPLGMNSASFGKESLLANDNWARSHSRAGFSDWRVREVKEAYYRVPAAGGINASILDMAAWLSAQMGHFPEVIKTSSLTRLHSPLVKTQAELRRNRRMTRLTDAHYGLGWRIYEYAGETVVNHSGSVEGYAAQIAFLPEHDVGIVSLSNSRSRAFWKVLSLFLDSELGLSNELLDGSHSLEGALSQSGKSSESGIESGE